MRPPTVHHEGPRPDPPLGAWAPESLARRHDHTEAPPTRRALWSGSSVSTNRLALAALALSLAWLGGLGSMMGVWCGHRARRQLAGQWQRGAGAAAGAIVVGWVGIVVAVVAIVVVVATPEALDQRLDGVERIVKAIFDERSPLG